MTLAISIGERFGSLTVLEIVSRGYGKARAAKCLCDCGSNHKTDVGRLFRGTTWRCTSCRLKSQKVYTKTEYLRRQLFHNYRNGARRRGYDFLMTMDKFLNFTDKPCVYCGLTPAKGIDRKDNVRGYILENCAPCCKQCNLAKRDMTEQEFFAWLHRLAQHQKAWL